MYFTSNWASLGLTCITQAHLSCLLALIKSRERQILSTRAPGAEDHLIRALEIMLYGPHQGRILVIFDEYVR